MDIISVALKRHSTKAFDASKKLTPEQAEQIKTLLQYSPSSTNSQPWHFIVARQKFTRRHRLIISGDFMLPTLLARL